MNLFFVFKQCHSVQGYTIDFLHSAVFIKPVGPQHLTGRRFSWFSSVYVPFNDTVMQHNGIFQCFSCLIFSNSCWLVW